MEKLKIDGVEPERLEPVQQIEVKCMYVHPALTEKEKIHYHTINKLDDLTKFTFDHFHLKNIWACFYYTKGLKFCQLIVVGCPIIPSNLNNAKLVCYEMTGLKCEADIFIREGHEIMNFLDSYDSEVAKERYRMAHHVEYCLHSMDYLCREAMVLEDRHTKLIAK